MRKLPSTLPLLCSAAIAATLTFSGCSSRDTVTTDATQVSDDHGEAGDHEHGEWWCAEHGVPEEDCALCDKSLVAKFKDAGDWCDEHNRPDSHCFICHPENFEKFAALYEAKYGARPKMPSE
jgi:hypothetical protein